MVQNGWDEATNGLGLPQFAQGKGVLIRLLIIHVNKLLLIFSVVHGYFFRDEFIATHLQGRKNIGSAKRPTKPKEKINMADLPASVDWRDQGVITSVRDQVKIFRHDANL